ncbi:MAG: hypothetical protein KatS3mg031_2346 [Chitinophagales bacterium]|nr:MAG: hypothetical protein KatS3mg031_2346 [Chitinophagales bacterium]
MLTKRCHSLAPESPRVQLSMVILPLIPALPWMPDEGFAFVKIILQNAT